MASNGSQVVLQQFTQLDGLFVCQVFRTLEKEPPCTFENRFITVQLELFNLLGSNLIDRLANELHHMKSVQDVDRLACFLEDHLEVCLPHVAAYELQLFGLYD